MSITVIIITILFSAIYLYKEYKKVKERKQFDKYAKLECYDENGNLLDPFILVIKQQDLLLLYEKKKKNSILFEN